MSTLQVSVNSELLMPYLIQKETQVSVCWMMHEQRCCKLQSTSAGRWSMCTHSTSTDAKKTTNCLSSSFELVLVSRARTAWVYLTWHIVNNIKRDSDKKKKKKKKEPTLTDWWGSIHLKPLSKSTCQNLTPYQCEAWQAWVPNNVPCKAIYTRTHTETNTHTHRSRLRMGRTWIAETSISHKTQAHACFLLTTMTAITNTFCNEVWRPRLRHFIKSDEQFDFHFPTLTQLSNKI